MRLDPLRPVSVYRTTAMVACPKCSGLGHIVEHQVIGDKALRIEHHCILCFSRGFVSREIAREWWMHRKASG